MPRRSLIFTVPPGKELHYSKIQGEILGKVWAPLFHAYGYYLPKANVPAEDQAYVNVELTENSEKALVTGALEHLLLWVALGRNPALISLIGGVVWAESESLFAYWDGHVTFGSSHVSAHCIGYGLTSIFMKKGFSKWSLPFILVAATILTDFLGVWASDGFAVTSDKPHGLPHRVDHLAHIGGIVVGMLTAWLTKNKFK